MAEVDPTGPGIESWTVASYRDAASQSSSSSPLSDLQRHLVNQQQSLTQFMSEWDELIDFVKSFPRKYVPRAVLLEKLEGLRPF